MADPEPFFRYLPLFDYILTDISSMPDAMIAAKNELGALRSLYLAMKYAFDEQLLKQKHAEILIFAGDLATPATQQLLFERLFEYLQRRTSMRKVEVIEIIENLPENKKTLAMSTYDNIIQEGVKQGKKIGFEGIEKGIELKNRAVVIELLRNTDFGDEKIALIVGAAVDFVAAVRAEIKN